MDDDPGAAEDERTIELASIAAIYPELIVDTKDPYTATLDLSVSPLKPVQLHFKPSADGAPPAPPTPPSSIGHGHGQDDFEKVPAAPIPPQLDTHELSHLPPLSLRITLPEDYPALNPPTVSVSVTPPWLPRAVIQRLKDDCAKIWEEVGRDQVVYAYIDHLQQEAENAFALAEEPNFHMSSDLKLALLDFDLKTKREHFEKETFDCGICLEPKKGIQCHKLLLCGHVFCVSCLQDFYKACITEGDVDNVKCLSPNCGKEGPAATVPNGRPLKRRKQDRTLNPSELLQIPIEQELVQRYVRFKRKRKLEADQNTIYCPRQWCQGAARSKRHPKPDNSMNYIAEESSESEEDSTPVASTAKKKKFDPESLPMSERLSVCEDCDFAFCCVCRKGWHGELAVCSPRRKKELDEEEAASLEYMKKYSTPCPTCNAPCQKTMGCNHMICFKCQTHFCYLCSFFLMPENPYSHFNDPKGSCYMRLWVLEGGDGEDAPRHAIQHPELADWDGIADAESDDDEEDLPPENFADFGGDDLRPFADEEDEDTSDEEPAPDQGRNRQMHIEIVNFARPGGQNPRRIQLPARPRPQDPPPPHAPDPPRQRVPRRRGGGQPANRQRAMRNEPARARGDVPAAHPGAGGAQAGGGNNANGNNNINRAVHVGFDAHEDENDHHQAVAGLLPLAAPGQGNHPAAIHGAQAGPVRAMGLERFLELARQDLEDEWDSDELEDDFGGIDGDGDGDEHHVPEPQERRQRGGNWNRGGRGWR